MIKVNVTPAFRRVVDQTQLSLATSEFRHIPLLLKHSFDALVWIVMPFSVSFKNHIPVNYKLSTSLEIFTACSNQEREKVCIN